MQTITLIFGLLAISCALVARYLAPGKTYRFEIEAIDFAQNRGPRTAIQVAVPAVEDTAAERMVRAWAEVVIAKALENKGVGGMVPALVDGLVPWVHRPWARTVLTQVRKLPKKRVDWKVRAKVTTLLGDTKE